MSRSTEPIVIVGAGQSGLAAARAVRETGLRPMILEAGPRDIHHWLAGTGFDDLPAEWLIHSVRHRLVMDVGDYRAAVESGRLHRRQMFTALDGDAVIWPGGEREHVDAVLLATGYLPSLEYPRPLGALSPEGCRCPPAACRSPTPAWSTWGWSSSARSPPTPCAG